MELYIIRHGQSTNNVTMVEDEYEREVDPPLTELGRKQAQALAAHLASSVNDKSRNGSSRQGFGLTRLYVSPMLRTLQTCQPISQATGVRPEVWVDTHEHGGLYMAYRDERGIVGHPGLGRSAILTDFADYLVPESVTDAGWWGAAKGREDVTGAQMRALRVATMLREAAETGERIGLVTHGTFADYLLKALLAQLPTVHHAFYHNNTGITRVDFLDKHRLIVRYQNAIVHLTPELVS